MLAIMRSYGAIINSKIMSENKISALYEIDLSWYADERKNKKELAEMKNNRTARYIVLVWTVVMLAATFFTGTAFADFGMVKAPTDSFAALMLHVCKLIGIFGVGLCVVRLGMAVQERDTENTLQNICFVIGCVILAFLREILEFIGLM